MKTISTFGDFFHHNWWITFKRVGQGWRGVTVLIESPHITSKTMVRTDAGCGWMLLSWYTLRTCERHDRVRLELGTDDYFSSCNLPTEEGGRDRQGHTPLHSTLFVSMGAQVILSINIVSSWWYRFRIGKIMYERYWSKCLSREISVKTSVGSLAGTKYVSSSQFIWTQRQGHWWWT